MQIDTAEARRHVAETEEFLRFLDREKAKRKASDSELERLREQELNEVADFTLHGSANWPWRSYLHAELPRRAAQHGVTAWFTERSSFLSPDFRLAGRGQVRDIKAFAAAIGTFVEDGL